MLARDGELVQARLTKFTLNFMHLNQHFSTNHATLYHFFEPIYSGFMIGFIVNIVVQLFLSLVVNNYRNFTLLKCSCACDRMTLRDKVELHLDNVMQ